MYLIRYKQYWRHSVSGTYLAQLSCIQSCIAVSFSVCLTAADGTLFEFVDGNEWRERGRGEFRINLDPATTQARMVMRQRGNLKLLMNARLYPGMATSKMVGGKGVTFSAVNAAAAGSSKEDGTDESAKGEGESSQPKGDESLAKDSGKSEDKGEGGSGDAGTSGTGTDKGQGAGADKMRTYALRVKAADKINEFVAVVDMYKTGGPVVPNPDLWV